MKLGFPIITANPESAYDRELSKFLHDVFRKLFRKVDGMASGVFADSADNALDSVPTAGEYARDDYVPKKNRTETGAPGAKYVVKGWIRLTNSTTHILGTDWVEDRALTGN
ncbi:MAG: hypothetical protein ACRCWJ_08780 [Casimicrobium sp.]